MKVVIDIPDEVFGDIKNIVKTNKPLPNQNIPTLLRMISDGTVLPKGHGDLIDRNSVLDMMNYGILEDNIGSMLAVIEADIGE